MSEKRIIDIVFRIDQYPAVARPSVEVIARLADENLGDHTWSAGRAVRVETTGDGSRAHIEEALKRTLDALEKL